MPLSMPSGIKAYVFDAYGTLFDVNSAVMRHEAKIGPEARASERSADSRGPIF